MYYESFFELNEAPFSISPDPRYLYLTESHREALAHLLYGVSSQGGFVLLTGEIGAGKTTVCQCLLEKLPENTEVAYIINPKLEPWEFFATVCDELNVSYPQGARNLKSYTDRLQKHLLDAHSDGRNTVLIVDEAQNLDIDLIEHLRLLTNLETREKKLLQIMLIGQPELRDKIAQPELRQMAQRITARFHLGPLKKNEISGYVRHRLDVAGTNRMIFDNACIQQLWSLTEGVPRLINVICDRAMLGAYATRKSSVDLDTLNKAAHEVLGSSPRKGSSSWRTLAWATGIALLMIGAFYFSYSFRSEFAQSVGVTAQLPSQSDVLLASADAEPMKQTGSDRKASAVEPAAELLQAENMDTALSQASMGEAASGDDVPVQVSVAKQVELARPLSVGDSLTNGFRALMGIWGRTYRDMPGGDHCAISRLEQLGCYQGTGNLFLLRNLDRPALLKLATAQGFQQWVVLEQIDANTVSLRVDGERQVVSYQALSSVWEGEYLLLWRMPNGYNTPLQLGANGNAVVWLQQQLKMDLPATRLGLFDASTQVVVRQFQGRSGLVPDGVAGPLTIITLNTQVATEGPRLSGAGSKL